MATRAGTRSGHDDVFGFGTFAGRRARARLGFRTQSWLLSRSAEDHLSTEEHSRDHHNEGILNDLQVLEEIMASICSTSCVVSPV